MLQSTSADLYQSEALQIVGVAAGIRKEIFKCEFSGHFPSKLLLMYAIRLGTRARKC